MNSGLPPAVATTRSIVVARALSSSDPITSEERKPDERFLRSVEDKIKISESGKISFRQEVVRKAMVAYKSHEKFTLNSHSRMREAIEQYVDREEKREHGCRYPPD
jgi:predicted Ser/Thr protein kinase